MTSNDMEALDRLVRGDCTPTEKAELEARIRQERELFEQYKLSRLLHHMLQRRRNARIANQENPAPINVPPPPIP